MRFFSNDNVFTRATNWIGIMVAANLMFLLTCLPIVTAGAGLAALYYTMLCAQRENGDINPFKTFWKGLKENVRQATVVWLMLLVLAALVYLEIFWCRQFNGMVSLFRYGLYTIGLVLAILAVYIFPVISTFQCTLLQQLKNSVGFALRQPAVTIALLFLNIVPMAWTFLTDTYMPLYAFLWCAIGFSGITALCSKLLLPVFCPYLGDKPVYHVVPQKSEQQILKEMRELEG